MAPPLSMSRLLAAARWTRGWAIRHYATAVRGAGWALAAWEVLVDRLHNLGVITAAAGMILYKNVVGRNGKDS